MTFIVITLIITKLTLTPAQNNNACKSHSVSESLTPRFSHYAVSKAGIDAERRSHLYVLVLS